MPIDNPYCPRLQDSVKLYYIGNSITRIKCPRINYDGNRVYCGEIGAYGCLLLSRLEKAVKAKKERK